ncbi:MAG: hypothetical protein PHI97_10920 [Desulfobulbus sp.]|nr:hypothetical protein [Desulfobulbus sp.]
MTRLISRDIRRDSAPISLSSALSILQCANCDTYIFKNITLVFTPTKTSSAFPLFAGGFVLSLVNLFYSALFFKSFFKADQAKTW